MSEWYTGADGKQYKTFKRKLTDEELSGLEWNLEGILKSPVLAPQLANMPHRGVTPRTYRRIVRRRSRN
jgi:hypothetical protein